VLQPDVHGGTGLLEEALRAFPEPYEVSHSLAAVLDAACGSGAITYSEVESAGGSMAEDVLLVAWRWKLLLPMRTCRSGEWDDRVLVAGPGEVYQVPNIVRYLVENARRTGRWSPRRAVTDLFRAMGEPAWQRMPDLLRGMRERGGGCRVDAVQIGRACGELGLEGRVDSLIAVMKGSGAMSPRLAPIAEVARAGSPLYELNPCLFVGTGLGGGESLSRLASALSGRFAEAEARDLARLLWQSWGPGSACYADLDVAPESKDDAILLACEERLLLPVRSVGGSAWVDRVLSFADDETYRMPHVVTLLVERAMGTGRWDFPAAAADALTESGESAAGRVVELLYRLRSVAPIREVDIGVMQAVSSELGMDVDMHDMLDRLVRSGIASPSTQRSLYAGAAKFEMHPCLCWEGGEGSG